MQMIQLFFDLETYSKHKIADTLETNEFCSFLKLKGYNSKTKLVTCSSTLSLLRDFFYVFEEVSTYNLEIENPGFFLDDNLIAGKNQFNKTCQ